MARNDQANDIFEQTSFLYGGNADYIDELYASYQNDPSSVNAEWREFFAALGDDAGDVKKNAQGASWAKPNWPIAANGDLVSALDGNWATVEKVVEKIVEVPKFVEITTKEPVFITCNKVIDRIV